MLNKKEIKSLERKLNLPSLRDSNGMVMPVSLSEREKDHVVFVMLAKVREENEKKFGKGIQKHWHKMSKEERT
jgi:hypothetical protein